MILGKHVFRGTVLLVSVFLARSAAADTFASFVGCSTAAGDDPTISPGTLDGTAGNARTDFLNVLSNKYYYEDFQEVTGFKNSKLAVSSSGYTLDFQPYGSPAGPTPTTETLTSTDATNGSNLADVSFHQGPIGPDTRGTFDKFETGLNDAYSGEGISDGANQYVDITPEGGSTAANYNVVITVSPGYNALGLMLNDVIQPNKTNVTVTFSNGATETMGALKSDGKDGTLASNNTWFLGIVDSAETITSVTITEQAGGDPIDLDNIYLGDISPSAIPPAVPLPVSVLGGGGLMGLLAIARRRSRIN